jgi:hypothetical protein
VTDQFASCSVCGELTSEYSNASCNFCFRPYHLALRNDIPSKDCGQVWISEEHMSLEFACNPCIGQQSIRHSRSNRNSEASLFPQHRQDRISGDPRGAAPGAPLSNCVEGEEPAKALLG